MDYQLTFSKRHNYKSLENGILLEVSIRSGEIFVQSKAYIDTGATVCLFSREIGEDLGFDIESGTRIALVTLTGGMIAYGHEVMLETLGIELQTTVYFSELKNLPRNLLGRQGWLQLVKLGLIDYDNEIYLSPYNKE